MRGGYVVRCSSATGRRKAFTELGGKVCIHYESTLKGFDDHVEGRGTFVGA